MKNYELLYILPSSLTSEEVKSNFEDIENNIKKLGVKTLETLLNHPFLVKSEISKEEESETLKNLPIIKRRLAYPVKKNRIGFYCLVNFSSEPEKIKEIDNYLKMNSAILRHIIIQANPMTKEELKELQKLFAKKRAEQEKEKKEMKKETEEKEKKVEIKKVTKVAKEEKIKQKEEMGEKAGEKKEKKEEVKEKKEEKIKEKAEEEKERRKTAKKKKVKLEDLEEKLDEILKDTMI